MMSESERHLQLENIMRHSERLQKKWRREAKHRAAEHHALMITLVKIAVADNLPFIRSLNFGNELPAGAVNYLLNGGYVRYEGGRCIVTPKGYAAAGFHDHATISALGG